MIIPFFEAVSLVFSLCIRFCTNDFCLHNEKRRVVRKFNEYGRHFNICSLKQVRLSHVLSTYLRHTKFLTTTSKSQQEAAAILEGLSQQPVVIITSMLAELESVFHSVAQKVTSPNVCAESAYIIERESFLYHHRALIQWTSFLTLEPAHISSLCLLRYILELL